MILRKIAKRFGDMFAIPSYDLLNMVMKLVMTTEGDIFYEIGPHQREGLPQLLITMRPPRLIKTDGTGLAQLVGGYDLGKHLPIILVVPNCQPATEVARSFLTGLGYVPSKVNLPQKRGETELKLSHDPGPDDATLWVHPSKPILVRQHSLFQ